MRNRGCCATIRGVNELSLQPRLKTVSQFPLLFIYFAVIGNLTEAHVRALISYCIVFFLEKMNACLTLYVVLYVEVPNVQYVSYVVAHVLVV